jgi:hypothetical protein
VRPRRQKNVGVLFRIFMFYTTPLAVKAIVKKHIKIAFLLL